jgi:peptidyl-prolyl cis-trans isomerase D
VISGMREYFRSLKFILLIVIVAFVVTSVVYFGTGTDQRAGGRPDAVATVNGERISVDRYRRAYANYLEFYRQMSKERLTPEAAERMGLPTQVLNELIEEEVVVQAATREGVRVSDEELRARIESMRAFHEGGRFSRDRYLAALRQARVDAADFEREQRRAAQRRKMESIVREGVKLAADEVALAYIFRREKVRAEWAALPLEPLLAQVAVTDADVESYLKSNQARFSRPERRRIELIVVRGRDVAAPVSDADAEAYYKANPAEFDKPRRVRAAHVLVRVPPAGASDAENRSKARVEEVIRRARAGEEFAKLAREVSEDQATASQGGDVGFVGRGEMVPQFEEAVFALKKGEVSPAPVRTSFGFHAIKVVDVEEGGRSAFKDVAPGIKEKLGAQRTEQAAEQRAAEVRASLQGAKDFAAEARRLGLEPRQATLSRGDGVEGIGQDAALEEAAFTLPVGAVSGAMKTAGGHVVFRVAEHLPGGVPPLAEIRAQVVEAVKRDRAEDLAVARATALIEAVDKGGEFRALAKRDGFSVGETPLFSRAEPPKDKDALPGAVLVAALQTPVGRMSAPLRTPGGVYVVRDLDRQAPDPAGLAGQRETIGRQVIEQKRKQAWESWIRAQQAAAKIDLSGAMSLGIR